MSLIIFFGFSLLVFLAGLTVISVTLYHWYKMKKQNQNLPSWMDSVEENKS
ncbi:MAG: hypothetical protein ACK41T_05605 [Pseudobdellovibrio sp.]